MKTREKKPELTKNAKRNSWATARPTSESPVIAGIQRKKGGLAAAP
jgi:hypothetical protein